MDHAKCSFLFAFPAVDYIVCAFFFFFFLFSGVGRLKLFNGLVLILMGSRVRYTYLEIQMGIEMDACL
jgi:hypothetical protein